MATPPTTIGEQSSKMTPMDPMMHMQHLKLYMPHQTTPIHHLHQRRCLFIQITEFAYTQHIHQPSHPKKKQKKPVN